MSLLHGSELLQLKF